jgi:hypothetical protein
MQFGDTVDWKSPPGKISEAPLPFCAWTGLAWWRSISLCLGLIWLEEAEDWRSEDWGVFPFMSPPERPGDDGGGPSHKQSSPTRVPHCEVRGPVVKITERVTIADLCDRSRKLQNEPATAVDFVI